MVTDKPKKPDRSAQSGASTSKGGSRIEGSGTPPLAQKSGPGSAAGGLSSGGMPTTGFSGRGTKSLGEPGDAKGGALGAAKIANGAADAATSAGLAQGVKNGAGGVAGKGVEGDGGSNTRRYTGKVVAGGVNGGMQGGLHGAAVGAAKKVGVEAAKDAVKGASKVTGGSPDAEPADKRLGAGGTSYERAGKKDAEGMSSKVAQGLAAGGFAAATPPATAVVMTMALFNWLKSMFFAFLAMAANMGNLLWTLFINVLKAVGNFVAAPFMAFGGFVANTVGAVFGIAVTTTVAPVTAAASGVVAAVTAVAMLGSVVTGVLNHTALTDGRIGSSWANCVVNARGGGGGAQVPANTEANAKTVYSVLSNWGMPDENIAGILGNWSQESGIDPTSVESVYDEPYRIGPRKQAAWDGGFTHIPGQSHGGIGLGQWSNGRTPMLLDYAKSKSVDWYTIEAQLAFMVEGDNPGDVQVFKDMIKTSLSSPGAAAVHFHEKWERSADGAQGLAERRADADMWYAKMSGWTVDGSVAGGVENIAGDIIDSIGTGTSTIFDNCKQEGVGGSVSLKDDGMTQEEAQALIDLFNKEGDKFLDERYGENGGPGSCGSNHAMNCVSFSTYFVNKYTTYQSYPMGNGIRTAYTIAEEMGKQVSSTPTPYSVGSGPGTGPEGHTLVVLGVHGDKLIVGEAGYCAFMGRVRVASASEMAAEGWKFVDMSDAMLPTDQIKMA
ncbi:phage tail tip lysozyme [Saccharopolyspora shandongensis]|uniref:phage tail tip lysozyme n=1 Tax=Saccharopolyspora shandongensis TaxID=418495 RepID=UPI0033F4F73A